jgi:hypothetical protein
MVPKRKRTHGFDSVSNKWKTMFTFFFHPWQLCRIPFQTSLKNIFMKLVEKKIDFSNRSDLFDALKKNTHIVAQYFDLRTQSYLKNVMSPVFSVSSPGVWYIGMIFAGDLIGILIIYYIMP